MKKRLIALITLLIFLFPTTAFAFDINKYYSDVRIGLENMMSTSISVTMLGNYTSGSDTYPAGSSFTLNFDNSQLNMNGSLYNEITFIPSTKDDLIKLKNGAKEYCYKGTMTFRVNGNNIVPVNTVSIEEYLKGVVAYEMSNSYPLEALKAQAVAARNYAIININKHSSLGYDLCDTTDCQVYRGYNSAYSNVIRAVDETSGILLMYNDEPAGCYYGASNGGWTESAVNVWYKYLPYLQTQKDDFDSEVWSFGDKKLTSADVQALLKSKGYLLPTDTFINIDTSSISYFESGRISNIAIMYSDINGIMQTKSFSKESARTFLGLPSALYTVNYDPVTDTYTFSGRGNGNGVGLSQIGARNRANDGQTFDQILGFYYPGTIVKAVMARINDIYKSKETVMPGEDITFSAVMDGNTTGDQLFKYTVEKDGKIVYTRDYDYNAQATFNPSEAGSYIVRLFERDINSQQEFDEQAVTGFSVYNLPVITAVSINPSQPLPNSSVIVNVAAEGGSSSGYDVIYDITKDGNTLFSNTGSNTFTFIPDKEGLYILNVKVRDKLSSNQFDNEKTVNINVQKTQEPSRGETQVFTVNRTLKSGVSGSDVTNLQNALGKLGYYTYGKATAYFGSVTENAVKSFQSKNGIKATGIVDTATASAINSALKRNVQTPAPPSTGTGAQNDGKALYTASRVLKPGVSGNDVVALQNALKKLGYFTYGSTTTYFGTYTKTAVINFQKNNGIKTTGIVDTTTAAAINKVLVSKAQAPASSTSENATTTKPENNSTAAAVFKLSRNLKKGVSGADVKQLQDILVKLGYLKEKSTGYYGLATETAVKAFQKSNKISQTGIVSSATAAAVNKALKG